MKKIFTAVLPICMAVLLIFPLFSFNLTNKNIVHSDSWEKLGQK